MKIACAQLRPVASDTDAALSQLAALAATAAAEGATILVTPEMYLTGYNIGAAAVTRLARPADGAYFQAVSRIARDNNLAIVYGFPELGQNGEVYNAAQLVGEDGAAVMTYRKTHLYGDVDCAQFAWGQRRSEVLEYKGWRVALAICYDVEFPELMRAYAQDGADLVLVPTANMLPFTGVATRLVPARAEENGIFVAYVNYVGTEGQFDYCGLSFVCGPDGHDIARAGTDAALVFADLTLGAVQENRKVATHLADLRPEIYE